MTLPPFAPSPYTNRKAGRSPFPGRCPEAARSHPRSGGTLLMKGTEVIQRALKGTAQSLNMYLADMSDADLLVRTSPNANHIAWQLGHLVFAEGFLDKGVLPNAKYPELPAGFDAKHKKETAGKDTGFGTKAEYLNLFNKAR